MGNVLLPAVLRIANIPIDKAEPTPRCSRNALTSSGRGFTNSKVPQQHRNRCSFMIHIQAGLLRPHLYQTFLDSCIISREQIPRTAVPILAKAQVKICSAYGHCNYNHFPQHPQHRVAWDPVNVQPHQHPAQHRYYKLQKKTCRPCKLFPRRLCSCQFTAQQLQACDIFTACLAAGI